MNLSWLAKIGPIGAFLGGALYGIGNILVPTHGTVVKDAGELLLTIFGTGTLAAMGQAMHANHSANAEATAAENAARKE